MKILQYEDITNFEKNIKALYNKIDILYVIYLEKGKVIFYKEIEKKDNFTIDFLISYCIKNEIIIIDNNKNIIENYDIDNDDYSFIINNSLKEIYKFYNNHIINKIDQSNKTDIFYDNINKYLNFNPTYCDNKINLIKKEYYKCKNDLSNYIDKKSYAINKEIKQRLYILINKINKIIERILIILIDIYEVEDETSLIYEFLKEKEIEKEKIIKNIKENISIRDKDI